MSRMPWIAILILLVPAIAHSQLVQWTFESGGNGHWYELVYSEIPVTWEEAEAYAESGGGHLATISSAEENSWIFETLVVPLAPISTVGVFLGGFHNESSPDYSEPDGGWEWVTGEPWDYEAWRDGEPNDGGDRGNYLEYANGPYQIIGWNDTGNGPEDVHYSFVAEYGDGVIQAQRSDWGHVKALYR